MYLKNTTLGDEAKMLKATLRSLFFGVAVLVTSFASAAQNIHDSWNVLLNKHVAFINHGHSTEVDYAAMKLEQHKLKAYLEILSAVSQKQFDLWEQPKQLAFLINAYNAFTVELILTAYPDISSIKALGSFFSSPWSKDFVQLLGKKRSLDNIEHGLIRGSDKYNDPRIHFAVNCASIGCPSLRKEAYTAIDLESQLEDQTIQFLSDNTRNRVEGNTLKLSSIFKWYRNDFEQGFRGSHTLQQFLSRYPKALKLDLEQQKSLNNDDMKVAFLDYNWDLNAQ